MTVIGIACGTCCHPLDRTIAETADTVTLSRSDWNAMLDRLEDTDDLAAVAARREHEARVGKDVARQDYLTADEVRRLLAGSSPVKLWREKRGLSQRALAEAAGISPSYLAEIETDRKPGSADALLRLSRVLGIGMEHLTRQRPSSAAVTP